MICVKGFAERLFSFASHIAATTYYYLFLVPVMLISYENNVNGGRVEVYYQGTWGTVCNQGWNIKDANVICRQLGFKAGTLFEYDSTAQPGNGTLWLKDLDCAGNESSITFCSRGSWNMTSGCSHQQDASLICLPSK